MKLSGYGTFLYVIEMNPSLVSVVSTVALPSLLLACVSIPTRANR